MPEPKAEEDNSSPSIINAFKKRLMDRIGPRSSTKKIDAEGLTSNKKNKDELSE